MSFERRERPRPPTTETSQRPRAERQDVPRKTFSAFSELVKRPEYAEAVSAFYLAYERRSRCTWLAESGGLPGIENGLAYALERALALYDFEPTELREACSPTRVPATDRVEQRASNG